MKDRLERLMAYRFRVEQRRPIPTRRSWLRRAIEFIIGV